MPDHVEDDERTSREDHRRSLLGCGKQACLFVGAITKADLKPVELRDAPAEVDYATIARVSDGFNVHPESLRVESGVLTNRDDPLDAKAADQLRVQFLNGCQFAHREAAIAQGVLGFVRVKRKDVP